MNRPKTLQQAIQHFSDEQVCIDAVAKMKWPNGAECPHCEAKDPYYLKTQKRWKCRKCRKQFSVKVGTIFEDSPIPLQKWMAAVWLLTGCKNGVSSWEIHRSLGVTQKTAWFMMHRIRLALRDSNKGKIGGEGSEVEVDETYVGGKVKNMHPAKQARYRAQSSTAMLAGVTGKTPVIGLLDRTAREIRTQVVPDVSRLALQNVVLRTVPHGTNVYTDQASAYQRLHKTYVDQIVNHAETYVNGRVHTNGLENFWSLFKRHISGTYVCVEPFHLERYLDEQVYRYNNRGTRENPMDDYARFEKALSQVANKRLTYAELTGKSGEAKTTTPEPF
jgi:transposase-like protein